MESNTVKTFDPQLLPANVAPYVIDVVDRMNKAPLSFAAVTALAVLSSAIGRRVAVRPKLYDDWTVTVNLWGMLIAPPSIKKSPIYSEMLKPLNTAELQENEKFVKKMHAYNNSITEKNYKQGKKQKSDPEEPKRVRHLLNDATTEKVAEIMIDNPYGLMLTLDELQGFFSSLEKVGREGDMSFWLEAFNGNSSKNIDRIGRGSLCVPHVCASVFGTIQPDVLSEIIFKTNNGTGGGNGLLQRFQLLAIELHSHFEYVDREPDLIARDNYTKLIMNILHADPINFGAQRDKNNEEIIYFRFSHDANMIFKEWTTNLHQKIDTVAKSNPSFAAHLGKLDGLFAALTLILFYADKVSGITIEKEIPKIYAEKAKHLCAFFESQAQKLYDMNRIGKEKDEKLRLKITNKIGELQTVGNLPISYGKLAGQIRGANADICRKLLKGKVAEKDGHIYGLLNV